MDERLKERLFDIIRKDIGVDPAACDPEKPIGEQFNLDSMQFVGVVARIELDLNIELPMSIMEVKTLNEFLKAINETIKKVTE